MNSGYSAATNDLDYIRRFRGAGACRNMFRKLGKERRQNAVSLVNDGRLFFASLFILRPEIDELNLMEELSERNRTALRICEKMLEEKNLSDEPGSSVPLNSEELHSVLLWMFSTGAYDDGLNDDFDQVLDTSASVLIKTHHEKTILPVMANMVFKRNQKGKYIHDLVWACFQSRDADALRIIASRLRSSAPKDAELARMLLHLPQDVPLRSNYDRQNQYTSYLSWLKENDPYLYFTGESFQFCNEPVPCAVDLEAKYLCKDNSIRVFKPLCQAANEESSSSSNFSKLAEGEKEVLAKHSQKLHRENPSYWNEWMRYPIEKQIHIARNGGGNSYDCNCR
ncbi:MAG: hypothetical protein GXY01_04040 [Clostridiales bacterium]|jgi:hypothetical protein|nr:hypothetical protein [Clostridiales bacterium]